MPISAKVRAALALRATTQLEPEEVLKLVAGACALVKGGGASLLTTGAANLGAQVRVERQSAGHLAMSITSGKRLVELCTFSAAATTKNGKTNLRVGGLETYKTNQTRLLLIPVGPKMILGYDPYKRYLQAVEATLRAEDPDAVVRIIDGS